MLKLICVVRMYIYIFVQARIGASYIFHLNRNFSKISCVRVLGRQNYTGSTYRHLILL